MPQKRAGAASLPITLFLPRFLRRERRAPSASRATRAFPTSEFRFSSHGKAGSGEASWFRSAGGKAPSPLRSAGAVQDCKNDFAPGASLGHSWDTFTP